jgi:hypothetical protein
VQVAELWKTPLVSASAVCVIHFPAYTLGIPSTCPFKTLMYPKPNRPFEQIPADTPRMLTGATPRGRVARTQMDGGSSDGGEPTDNSEEEDSDASEGGGDGSNSDAGDVASPKAKKVWDSPLPRLQSDGGTCERPPGAAPHLIGCTRAPTPVSTKGFLCEWLGTKNSQTFWNRAIVRSQKKIESRFR